MEVVMAKIQGFCSGVINAIKITKETLTNKNTKWPVYILGSIVHNKYVSESFRKMGLITISYDDIKNINEGTIIFSAHGVSPKVLEEVKSKGLDYVDATCPKVKKIHDIVKSKVSEGYQVAFLGKKNHEETIGVLGISDNVVLVNDYLEIENIKNKVVLVCQTTLSHIETNDKFKILKEKYPQLELLNAICNATYSHQKSSIEAANETDLAIVVGDKMSNNCKTLADSIEKNSFVKTIMIETAEDLNKYDLSKIKRVMLTSGASTPKAIVLDVKEKILSNNKNYVNQFNLFECIEG